MQQQQQQQQYIRNFLIIERIGKGASGQVFKVSDQKQIYSLKVQGYCSNEEKQCIQFFSGLKFQNIVNHYENFDIIIGIQNLNCTVMDYCNSGDLYNYLSKNRHLLNSQHKQEIIFQIGFGIWEMSQLDIIHRDIKPQNILVHNDSNTFKFQICDLGISKLKGDARTLNIGTPYYMAPELIDEKASIGQYDSSVDIWAFGGLIFDLYSPIQLFNGNSLREIFNSVKSKQIEQDLQRHVSDEAIRTLIQKMIQIDPKKRPSIDEILNELNQPRFQLQKEQYQKRNESWFNSQTQSQIQNTVVNFNNPNNKQIYIEAGQQSNLQSTQAIKEQEPEKIEPIINNNETSYSDNFVVNRARLRRLLKDDDLIIKICTEIQQNVQKDQIKKTISEYLDELIDDLKFE